MDLITAEISARTSAEDWGAATFPRRHAADAAVGEAQAAPTVTTCAVECGTNRLECNRAVAASYSTLADRFEAVLVIVSINE